MFTNSKTIYQLFFLVIGCFFLSCKGNANSKSIFDEIFSNIAEDPSVYENDENYEYSEIKKNDKDFPFYAEQYGCDLIFKVKNNSMNIMYWNISGKNQIQTIMILKDDNCHPLSKFIGKTSDDVLKRYSYNKEYQITASELRYDSADLNFFIQFQIKNGVIKKIIAGRNL